MSAEEDTELQDLIAQTLESNGTLGKLRAQLRASVFLALEDQENGQSKTPYLNKELRSFLSSKEGRLTANLVQEFLDFFSLDYTQAVFKPETGLIDQVNRSELISELGLSKEKIDAPVLTSLLFQSDQSSQLQNGAGDSNQPLPSNSKDLSDKQIKDARQKFEYYDKDKNGTIDKDELRELFLDMFPSFHKNMLERYVNDEFKAVDKDFSSTIDFNEFLDMYKRLFLFCRTVVAGDVSEILSTSQKQENRVSESRHSINQSKAKPILQNGSSKEALRTENDRLSSDLDEDPFFDDMPSQAPVSFNTLSNEYEKNKDNKDRLSNFVTERERPRPTGGEDKEKPSAMGSLAGAPPLKRPKSPTNDVDTSDLDKNLRAMDKRLADLGIGDPQNDDFEYEDDFSEQSQPKGNDKQENGGSIAEEIDEEIDDISIEADDLLQSEKSGFDDLTTDHSISQADGGFDYAEDPVLP